MFGHGGGALSKAYQEFEYYPHNSYIMIAFEYGVFGIFLIISYLFLVALRSRAVPLGQFIVLVLALYSIFNDLHMTPHFWFTLGVVATLTKYFTKKINL
jgi:O-antigen ligase